MSASLAFQKAVRGQLIADAAITALVPADSILDRHGRPERFPCLLLGNGQELPAGLTLERQHVRAYLDLHLWRREPGLAGIKTLASAIRRALDGADLALDGCQLVDLRFDGARFMRDPDGETAHGVVTIEALIEVTP